MTVGGSDTISLKVVARQEVADGIATLELRREDGRGLPPWTPGAHIDLATVDKDERPVFRQYSLCGAVEAPTWRIAVLADAAGRGGSLWLHHNAHPGTRLASRHPGNHFALKEAGGTPVVLVAGGIGITPLIPMAHALQARGVPFRLLYYVRRESRAAFLTELKSAPFANKVHLSVDEGVSIPPQDIFSSADAGSWVYTCGPAGFMDAVTGAARACGVSPERISQELFASDGATALPRKTADQPFTVRLHSTGQEVAVRSDQSVVQALAEAGVQVTVSCEQGYCGSCLTGLLDGIPDHRDQFMLDEERARNDAFTPCCSRALSPCLVLDL